MVSKKDAKNKTVILDNGASDIKIGVLGLDKEPKIIPNGAFRSKGDKATYVGRDFLQCKDFASLHYRLPFEKGYLVDWDVQKAVWDDLFSNNQLGVDTSEVSLLMTEPYFNLPKFQEIYDQFVFEEYEFQSYRRCTPASLMPHSDLFRVQGMPTPDCMIIVDSGFSFTHVVPIMAGSVVWNAVKRIDVGGKLLTNHLKELVSFRQWNMMDETYIINNVKEACCYVSQDYKQDLEICRTDPQHNPIVRQYVLPDYSVQRQGYVLPPGEAVQQSYQILSMNNERFSVPEILFRPDDIGLDQSGLPATIAHSISLLPEDLQGMFWANIGLIGGSTKFPGFRERLMTELRSLAPVDCEVEIFQAKDPVLTSYHAAARFASHSSFSHHVVTKAEYQESGSNACRRKFQDWRHAADKDFVAIAATATVATAATSGKSKGKGKEKGKEGEDEMDWEEEVVEVVSKKNTKRKKDKGKGVAG